MRKAKSKRENKFKSRITPSCNAHKVEYNLDLGLLLRSVYIEFIEPIKIIDYTQISN
jgi:hypothetical protein